MRNLGCESYRSHWLARMAEQSSGADAYAGAGAFQRVRKAASSRAEVYDAGASDGMSAGDFIVGWGSMVRRARHAARRTPCNGAPRRAPRRTSWEAN